MIGQKKLLQELKHLVDSDKFPRFMILVGSKGSGKKTVATKVLPTLFKSSPAIYTLNDVKVDSVRAMITDAYKIQSEAIFIMPDADKMSLASKNAILKVTEEPPSKAYIILTVQDSSQLLDTIKSRAIIMNMDTYSRDELSEYYISKYKKAVTDKMLDIATTPYELDMIETYGAEEFYSYVTKVIDNIATVSGSNSFKIADKIALKDEDDKYDLMLFLKAFIMLCSNRLLEDAVKYGYAIKITSKTIQSLITINGLNKSSAFDVWLLNIRKAWR